MWEGMVESLLRILSTRVATTTALMTASPAELSWQYSSPSSWALWLLDRWVMHLPMCSISSVGSLMLCLLNTLGHWQIAPPMSSFTSAKAAIAPMIDIINRKPLIDNFSNEGQKPTENPRGNINFRNVRFSYPSRPEFEVYKGYDLSISSGECVALVGASGSGKVRSF